MARSMAETEINIPNAKGDAELTAQSNRPMTTK